MFSRGYGVDEGSLKVEYRHLCSVFALKTKRRLCFKDNETSPHRINCRVSRTCYVRSPNILKLTQMRQHAHTCVSGACGDVNNYILIVSNKGSWVHTPRHGNGPLWKNCIHRLNPVDNFVDTTQLFQNITF